MNTTPSFSSALTIRHGGATRREIPEGLATFFVALSRAKQRAIFASAKGAGQRRRVAELFQLLTDAGVPEIAI